MLIVVVAVLVSIMGMNGNATVKIIGEGFNQASPLALTVGPLVYTFFRHVSGDALTNWQKEPDNSASIDNSKSMAEAK